MLITIVDWSALQPTSNAKSFLNDLASESLANAGYLLEHNLNKTEKC